MMLAESELFIRQIKAARSLLGWSRAKTAAVSGVEVLTIEKLEAADCQIEKQSGACAKIVRAFEAAGIEFLHHNHPGVRLKTKTSRYSEPVGPATDVIDQMDAAIEADRSRPSKA